MQIINSGASIQGGSVGSFAVELVGNGTQGLDAWLATSHPNYIPMPYQLSLSGADAEHADHRGKTDKARQHMCSFDKRVEQAIGDEISLSPATTLLLCSSELSTKLSLPRGCG